MTVRRWPVVGVVLAVLWVVVRGVELTPQRLVEEGLIGLVVGLAIAYGLRRMYREEVDVARALLVAPTAAYYVALFLWEVLTANLDVAYRVLHPAMPIDPDVVEVPLRVESDAAVTSIANSITLTPGTLTMDHDAETNTLYVHGIVGTRREEVLAPIRRWEDLLLVVFDEDAAPEADPPEPPSDRAPLAREGARADEREARDRAASETGDRDSVGDDGPEPDEGGDGGGD